MLIFLVSIRFHHVLRYIATRKACSLLIILDSIEIARLFLPFLLNLVIRFAFTMDFSALSNVSSFFPEFVGTGIASAVGLCALVKAIAGAIRKRKRDGNPSVAVVAAAPVVAAPAVGVAPPLIVPPVAVAAMIIQAKKKGRNSSRRHDRQGVGTSRFRCGSVTVTHCRLSSSCPHAQWLPYTCSKHFR